MAGVAALFGGGGCARRICGTPYWQVVTTDVEGCWIAQWIAEDEVKNTGDAYCFRAVQRRIFRPYILTFRYPLGRLVKVKAPNIIITPAEKPLWLVETDRYAPPPDQCRVRRCGFWKK